MKESWYGDKRDLLKWSAVLHLCKQHRIESVFHVAMVTEPEPHTIIAEGQRVDVEKPVWQHFRSLENTLRLFRKDYLHIFDRPFTHKGRAHYFTEAVDELKALAGRKLVLLDPDTGLEPTKVTEKHITLRECITVWSSLAPSDLLLLYQHSWRAADWKDAATKKLEDALDHAPLIKFEAPFATDVVLLGAINPSEE
jgi:hypothetical protein